MCCLLVVLHLLLHKAPEQLGARNREGPRQSELSPLDEHSVPYQHVKKTSGGSSSHGGKTKKAEMDQSG